MDDYQEEGITLLQLPGQTHFFRVHDVKQREVARNKRGTGAPASSAVSKRRTAEDPK
jgi:hypothetical protein